MSAAQGYSAIRPGQDQGGLNLIPTCSLHTVDTIYQTTASFRMQNLVALIMFKLLMEF